MGPVWRSLEGEQARRGFESYPSEPWDSKSVYVPAPLDTPPLQFEKPTCNLIKGFLYTTVLLKGALFSFHVNFPECKGLMFSIFMVVTGSWGVVKA